MKSKGLGDTIEKITRATGIHWAIKRYIGDCGCENRKEWLNQQFPYHRDLTDSEAEELTAILSQRKDTFNGQESAVLFRIYNDIHGLNKRPRKCQACNKQVVTSLVALLEKRLH